MSPYGLSRGGDDGIRTHDPLLAGQVLSQLSYTPLSLSGKERFGELPSELSVSALTYFPGPSPAKYFRHSRGSTRSHSEHGS